MINIIRIGYNVRNRLNAVVKEVVFDKCCEVVKDENGCDKCVSEPLTFKYKPNHGLRVCDRRP